MLTALRVSELTNAAFFTGLNLTSALRKPLHNTEELASAREATFLKRKDRQQSPRYGPPRYHILLPAPH